MGGDEFSNMICYSDPDEKEGNCKINPSLSKDGETMCKFTMCSLQWDVNNGMSPLCFSAVFIYTYFKNTSNLNKHIWLQAALTM